MHRETKKPLFLAAVAGSLLLALYFLVLVLANSFSHALTEFSRLWYWILILVLGFSFQAYLYFYIKESQKAISGKILAGSGGVSGGSMIACCLHHLSDVLPIMGLTGAAIFLTQYQTFFIALGVLSNLIGIIIMLGIIKKNNLAKGFLEKISAQGFAKIKMGAIILSPILLLIIFFYTYGNSKSLNEDYSNSANNLGAPNNGGSFPQPPATALTSKIDSRGGIAFEVTPLNFNYEEPLNFTIKIDTHSGSLDFDLTKISTLQDSQGNIYSPTQWQGPAPGGHHVVGTLIFPALKGSTEKIRIKIKDSSTLPPRVFEWDII